jgi:hypothetical protein
MSDYQDACAVCNEEFVNRTHKSPHFKANPTHRKPLPETETLEMVNVPEPAREQNITFDDSVFAADDNQPPVNAMIPLPVESIVQNVTTQSDSPAARQSTADRQQPVGQSRIANSSAAMVAIPPPGLSVTIRSTTKGKKITMDTYCEQLVQIGFRALDTRTA